MDFIEYTKEIYRKRLDFFDRLIVTQYDAVELQKIACEASSMRKFMYDIRSEGYEYTFQRFTEELDFDKRIAAFLQRSQNISGGPPASRMFHLHDGIDQPQLVTGDGGTVYELSDYLDRLERLTARDIDMREIDRYPAWIEKTRLVLDEMHKFVSWLRAESPDGRFACLLRDALLPYLALRRTGNEAVPLIVGRKYLAQYDAEFFNDPVMDVLYDALAYDNPETGELTAAFARRFRERTDDRVTQVATIIRAYLNRHLKQETYTVVESGVQGTMPLLLAALDDRVIQFRMYATLPWLSSVYGGIIFQQNYHYLMEIERIVCHNELFRFEKEEDGRIYVRETDNQATRAFGYYEIVRFAERF